MAQREQQARGRRAGAQDAGASAPARRRKLKGLSDIRRFFHRNAEPIYFLSATSFNLIGIDEWVGNFKFVNSIDCFDGQHPHLFCPPEIPHPQFESIESNFYVRTETDDRPGVLAAIATVFGSHNVSLESMLQKQAAGESAEIVWITHRTNEGNLRAALKEIEALPVVRKISNWIRVEE